VTVLNAGRLSLAAGCTQGSKALVGEMARYAEQRIQFGAPLASFEITQRKLSSLAAESYAATRWSGHLSAALDRPDVDASLEAARPRCSPRSCSGARPTTWCRWPGGAAT
jgi:acyl-CoA dehydrogenase family protein 9